MASVGKDIVEDKQGVMVVNKARIFMLIKIMKYTYFLKKYAL